MSTASPQIMLARKPSSSFYIIGMLSFVSTICGIVIVLAYLVTLKPIAHNLAVITNQAVGDVIPGGARQVIYALQPSGEIAPVPDVSGKEQRLYAVYDASDQLLGIAVEAEGPGYGDLIKLMYAYSPEKEAVIGFRLLDAKETPGLGDRIGIDPDFLANFQSLEAKPGDSGLLHPMQVVKHGTKSNPWEIDGISGATVSSNAVGRIVNESAQKAIPLIQRNLDQIRKGV